MIKNTLPPPSPLALAASRGEASKVAELLAQGADPALVGESGRTALMAACSNGHYRLVAPLAANGAASARDPTGANALHMACAYGHGMCVIELAKLAQSPAMAQERDLSGRTPMLAAAARGDQGCVALMIDLLSPDPEAVDASGRGASLLAAASGMRHALSLIFEHWGAFPERPALDGSTLLHEAARSLCPGTIALAASRGDPLARDNAGRTPLMAACAASSEGVVERLLPSPFFDAVRMADREMESVELLLRIGSDPIARDASGGSALSLACSAGATGIALALAALDTGAWADGEGLLPSARALHAGHHKLAETMESLERARGERAALGLAAHDPGSAERAAPLRI